MTELVLATFDWVPEPPRLRPRPARALGLEEAGLACRDASTPFRDRGPEHLAYQPFGQVPWRTDGAVSIFGSGAILLHLGGRTEALLPSDPAARGEPVDWLFAALKSVEIAPCPGAAELLRRGGRHAGFS